MKYLVLDDEIFAQRILQDLLKKIDSTAEVFITHSPLLALEYLKEYDISIVLSDIQMPEMDGLEFVRKAKAIAPMVSVILITAYAEYALDAFGLYVSGYLLKPVREAELREALKHLRPLSVEKKNIIKVQCYGNFDIYVNNERVHFARSKAKELLAYLVWRRGASITTGEATAVLFEDKEYNKSLRSQIQTIISSLRKTLEDAGIGNLLERNVNSLSINPSIIQCDLYAEMDECKAKNIPFLCDEYLQCYDWTIMR